MIFFMFENLFVTDNVHMSRVFLQFYMLSQRHVEVELLITGHELTESYAF